MFLMITGLIWLATGVVMYRSERKPDPDTRFDRNTRAEAAGLALLWPLVLCIILLYGVARRVHRLIRNKSH
ncbi:hypothetical protein [Pantoea agglomerans]|uniref:hypothetical protein n=1 Tax=Enterobacter agglomerans TaxID=549 RepID=UPI003CF8770B